MMERQVDELSRVLGGMEQQLKMITQTLSEDRIADATYRTDARREMADTKESVDGIRSDVTGVMQDVAEMRPKVEGLEIIKIRKEGAARLVDFIGKIMHFIVAVAGGITALLAEHWLRKS